jgi:hypothetical protein
MAFDTTTVDTPFTFSYFVEECALGLARDAGGQHEEHDEGLFHRQFFVSSLLILPSPLLMASENRGQHALGLAHGILGIVVGLDVAAGVGRGCYPVGC